MNNYISPLINWFGAGIIKTSIPLNRLTSFKVGGPADAFLETDDFEAISAAISCCRENGIPYFILGGGTNILVSDKGYRGLVIKIFSKNGCYINENGDITTNAGLSLPQLARFAYENALAGMEALAGIPGSIGGAVYMNAGAYGSEIKDTLVWADIFYDRGIIRMPADDLQLSYRSSILQKDGGIVIEAAFRLATSNKDDIKARMAEFAAQRREKQPLDLPSAGSAFKRPKGYYAAKLIEDCGLKGCSAGGAQVSEKHAGFIVNTGGATAADIHKLIIYIIEEVEKKTGVTLEPEIRFIGEF